MFEKINYAELEEMRIALLEEMVGTLHEDKEKLQLCADISDEIDRREAEAAKRLLPAVCAVNILVLASILFVAGCQTVKGVTGDAGWILTEMSDNIQTEK